MSKRYLTSLFVFRRDLRLFDNNGLNAALRESQRVLACFIFDPRQIEPHPYQSQPGLQFMLETLEDLQCQLIEQGGRLHWFRGRPESVIVQLKQSHGVEAVFVNRDYTPFSRQRDAEIKRVCGELGIQFHSIADALLNEPEAVLKDDGSSYRVFTSFYHRAMKIPVKMPQTQVSGCFIQAQSGDANLLDRYKKSTHSLSIGSRKAALERLDALEVCRNYGFQRDFPSDSATSDLSAFLKFGCCSIREAYYAVLNSLGGEHPLLRQFYWRDFFAHVGFHFPHVFGHAFHRRYDAIGWRNDETEFTAWMEGRTGFPIVDAGMRQLKQTGCMHNRVRMITASFLVKDLQIDWRWGERYFARHLLDYDPCVNNGNWQWAASTGCDAQPFFRIFNPWLQQKKFDADCLYIKRWLPELKSHSPTNIHNGYKNPSTGDYPSPIVNHVSRSQQSKAMFRQAQGT
ncbi:MAG: deoxyribodipyrimidine photo-lyase [Methylomonas sp.]|nr:deoxyribodipyrimidine photo-lyase [Methylomonas sp.]